MPTKIAVSIDVLDKNEPTKIRFKFSSNEEVRFLKFSTPLMGLTSRFLNIEHMEKKEAIKYEGLLMKFCSPTPEDFTHLKPNAPIQSQVIDLAEAYVFPCCGKYLIKYTAPLVYLANNDANPVCNFQEVQSEKTIFLTRICNKKSALEPKHHSTALLKELGSFPKVIEAVDDFPVLYEKWFGDPGIARKDEVKCIYRKCSKLLQEQNIQLKISIPEGDSYGCADLKKCEIVVPPSCKPVPKGSDDNISIKQILVHLLVRMLGDPSCSLYGAKECRYLAKSKPDQATQNADNYGYFYCDVIREVASSSPTARYVCVLLEYKRYY